MLLISVFGIFIQLILVNASLTFQSGDERTETKSFDVEDVVEMELSLRSIYFHPTKETNEKIFGSKIRTQSHPTLWKTDVPDFMSLSADPELRQETYHVSMKKSDSYKPADHLSAGNPRKNQLIPDPLDVRNILNLAKMSNNAYLENNQSTYWMPVDGVSQSVSFGYESDGLRGYVFTDTNHKLAVIAIKGTSASFLGVGSGPTSKKDKIQDNLMFSCCCAAVDRTWWPVCGCASLSPHKSCDMFCLQEALSAEESYLNMAKVVFEQVRMIYPNAAIWTTGHSLGGAVASLVAISKKVPAVVFASPGDRLYANRMGLGQVERKDIYHFGLSSDPIFMGECTSSVSPCYIAGYAMESKCHTGNTCFVPTDSGLNIRYHVIKQFISEVERLVEEKAWFPKCVHDKDTDCVDCPDWSFDNMNPQ